MSGQKFAPPDMCGYSWQTICEAAEIMGISPYDVVAILNAPTRQRWWNKNARNRKRLVSDEYGLENFILQICMTRPEKSELISILRKLAKNDIH